MGTDILNKFLNIYRYVLQSKFTRYKFKNIANIRSLLSSLVLYKS